MTQLPVQALLALATITATLITSVVGLVNMTLGKELKVSEMRRDWIEALRSELSDYFQSMRHLSIAADELADASASKNAFKRERVEDSIILSNTSFYTLCLRLNSNKPLQERLLNDLKALDSFYNGWQDGEVGCGAGMIMRIEAATLSARELIDQEWKQVKNGEPTYVNVRRWLVPGTLIIIIICVVIALSVHYK